MCTDEDKKKPLNSLASFYGEDSHVSRFFATTVLQITFTVTRTKCLNH